MNCCLAPSDFLKICLFFLTSPPLLKNVRIPEHAKTEALHSGQLAIKKPTSKTLLRSNYTGVHQLVCVQGHAAHSWSQGREAANGCSRSHWVSAGFGLLQLVVVLAHHALAL